MEQERAEREDIEQGQNAEQENTEQQTAEQENAEREQTEEGAEETAQEREQKDTHGSLCFEIVECGDYTDKKLQREFGRFVLSRRPLWNKVCEGLVIVSMVILVLVFLEMGMRTKEAFLGWFMQGLCIGFAIGFAIVAVWGAVYMWALRPGIVGRRRLSYVKADSSTIRYYEDKLVLLNAEGKREAELPYDDRLPWGKVYVGEHALYLEIKAASLFYILQPKNFTVGSIDDFPRFLWEKAGVSAKEIT